MDYDSITTHPYTLVRTVDEDGATPAKLHPTFHRTVLGAKRAAVLTGQSRWEIRDMMADDGAGAVVAIGTRSGWWDPRR